MSTHLSQKPMIVIDLGSGSFVREREGHEYFNLLPNSVDNRYYGYCPPHDNIALSHFTNNRSVNEVSGVLVVYVKKYRKSNDRVIVGFTDNATIHREKITDKSLDRVIEENGKFIHCSYSIESDNMFNLDNYPRKHVISIKEHPHMFRMQRFYKGKYPELDKAIIKYLEDYLQNTSDDDTLLFQRLVQEENISGGKPTGDSSKSDLDLTVLGGSKVVNKKASISKRALAAAGYKCMVDPAHKTFNTEKNLPYMEGHHLIPCTFGNAIYYYEQFNCNIDCEQNIVCLCPTCHRQVHFGSKDEKQALLQSLYDKQIGSLRLAGIDISFEELLKLYE